MNKLVVLIIILGTVCHQSIAQKFEWASPITSIGWVRSSAITIDAVGNSYVTGAFTNPAKFNSDTGIVTLHSVDGHDLYVSKWDTSGNFVWAKGMGGQFEDIGRDVCVDKTGNVIVAGKFSRTVDFDPDTSSVFNLTGVGQGDGFVFKLDSLGDLIWAKNFASTVTSFCNAHSVICDTLGNIYTVGYFSDTVDFDPGIGVYNLITTGPRDAFVCKLDSMGNFLWAFQIGGNQSDEGYDIKNDNLGNLYVCGDFRGVCDFDPGIGVYNLSATGSPDTFISKFSSSGNFIWAKNFGGASNNYVSSISLDGSRNIYTTGRFTGTVDFNPGIGVFNLVSVGNDDTFISKIDSVGNFLWAKSFTGGSDVWGNGIAADSIGNVFVTGMFWDTVDFDPGVNTYNLVSQGGRDMYLSKLDSSGSFQWASRIGGNSSVSGNSICLDESGNIFSTGYFNDTADFDPNIGVFEMVSGLWGSENVFLCKTSPCGPTYSTDIHLVCDSLVWIDGNTYSASTNSPTFSIPNAGGCDSTINLNLTVQNSSFAVDTLIACDSLIWINGVTYYLSNNTATDTLVNSIGCDSIITLNLTLNYSTIAIDTNIACDSLTWIDGVTYYSSNSSATVTLINSIGCDSIITLNLTINASVGIDTLVACDSLTWIDGITYYSNNNLAKDTLLNSAGCDSIVTLNLTILNSTFSIDTTSACDSLIWINGMTYYSSNNSATDTLVNSVGCDSIVALYLTVVNTTFSTDTLIVCDSVIWTDGITYYSNNSTALDTMVNSNGCDSIITLDLTVQNSSFMVDTLITCDSLIWINGMTYYSSNNSATDTLVNSVGCDSIVTLDLTVLNATASMDVIVACDSLTWIDGMTYYSSTNSVSDTLVNSIGCDSIITLNLTINNSSTKIDTVFACDNYTWINGITYYASNNTTKDTLVNVAGCDSIVTLNLTISNLISSYSFSDNGSANYTFTNTSTGNYTNSYWAFGDGVTSLNTNSSHTYTANGMYIVALAIQDSLVLGDSCISYFLDTINVTGVINSVQCNAGWVVLADSSTGGVTIINSSTGTNLTYHWDFGDGDTSNLQFPSHTYASNGPFNLCLTVDDGNGCSDTYCDSISSNGVLFKNGFDLNVLANYPLGIQNITSESNVKIYPNPTSSQLNIEAQNFEITKIQILDITGKVVKTITSNFDVVNVESLAVGVYHLKLIGEGETITKKFIKQ